MGEEEGGGEGEVESVGEGGGEVSRIVGKAGGVILWVGDWRRK